MLSSNGRSALRFVARHVAITFGSVSLAANLMLLGRGDQDPRSGSRWRSPG